MPEKINTLLIYPKVVVDIEGKPYTYFMTNNYKMMNHKLEELGCRHLRVYDYHPNPVLSEAVKDKMVELGVTFSLTLSNGAYLLNYYKPGRTPLIVWLTELIDPWRKAVSDCETISVMQKVQNMILSIQENEVQVYWPPIMCAVAKGDLDWVKFLLKAGVFPDEISPKGLTALMVAVIKNNKELVELLLEHGADVNAMTATGWTPYRLAGFLFLADGKDRTEIGKILEKAGARIDLRGLPCSSYLKRMSFQERLNVYIERFTWEGQRKESLIYKHCNMDKRTFHKIKNTKTPNYHPRKNTVFSLIIGMELTLAEAEDLLSSAGYAFDQDDEFDKIIKKYVNKQDYNIKKIEKELFEVTGKTLSYYEKDAGE